MNDQNQDVKKQNNNFSVMIRTVIIFAICICAILLMSQFEAVQSVFSSIFSVLTPVMMGVIFAYIINPLDVILERAFLKLFAKSKKMKPVSRVRWARSISITISMIALLSAIVLLLFLIIPEFWNSLVKFVGEAPETFSKISEWFDGIMQSENILVTTLAEHIGSLGEMLSNWINNELSSAISGVVESVIVVFGFLFDFLVAIVICVYALIEKRKFMAQSKKLIFALFKPSVANDILNVARYSNEVFGKFISGKLITSTIVGILTFTFMTIMDMPFAFLSAGIIAVTNVIPFFGPFIGGIPTALIVLFSNAQQGVIYIIFMLVLQQIEGNVIEPMIMEDRIGVSKFWITSALLVLGGAFGLLGMIFSVPFIAVLFYCIKMIVERNLEKKSLPLPSGEYLNVGSVDLETGELLDAPPKHVGKKFGESISEWRDRIRHKNESEDEE